MKTKTVTELREMMNSGVDFQLIDVREPYEYEMADIGGHKIPMAEVPARVAEVAKDKPVVVYCRSGKRSANICMFLEQNQQLENVYNLDGGILAWADQIDQTIPKY